MKKRIKEHILQKRVFLILLILAILVYYFSGDSIRRLQITVGGLFFVLVAYPIGLLSPILAIMFTLFSFMISLPIISSIYLLLASVIANIHYFIFGKLFKGVLRRIPAYAKLEIKVRHTGWFK